MLSFEPWKTVHGLSRLSCSEWLSRVEWLLLGLQRSEEKTISEKSITAQSGVGLGSRVPAAVSVHLRAKWRDQITVKCQCWLGMRWTEMLSICQEGNIPTLPIRQCRQMLLGFLSLAPMVFSGTHCFSALQVFRASATAGSTVPP